MAETAKKPAVNEDYRMPPIRTACVQYGFTPLHWHSILRSTDEACVVIGKFRHPKGRGSLYRVMLFRGKEACFQDVSLEKLRKPSGEK